MDSETRKKLNEIANNLTRRKWSPVQTDECPIPDPIQGGFMESDELLRQRLWFCPACGQRKRQHDCTGEP